MTRPTREPARPSRLLRLIAFLVPRDRREEWLEEWQAELAALDAAERWPANGEDDVADPVSPSGSGPEGDYANNVSPSPSIADDASANNVSHSRSIADGNSANNVSHSAPGPNDDAVHARGLPGRLAFIAGAVPHALWIRREEWTVTGFMRDVRYAVRVLVRSPGFTIVAALTLALGIGANATVFSLVNGLVLQPPSGVVEPDRLVQIARSYEDAPRWDNWSWPAMLEIRESAEPVFEAVIGHQGRQFIMGEGVEAEPVVGEMVTGNFFGILGVRAVFGRLIEPSDHMTPGAHPVVVLGWNLWQRRFGGDPGVIGTAVSLSGSPYEVIGVAPRGFTGVETLRAPAELFIPAIMHPAVGGRLPFDEWGWSWFELVGRLRADVSFEQAEAAMAVVSQRLRDASSANEDIEVLLEPGIGLDPEERAESTRLGFLLMGIAGLVLLLTCANVANLFIARSTARTGEMGVRVALGAGWSRIARQLTIESLVLALAAALVAVPIVIGAAGFLPALLPTRVATSLPPDARVFAALVALGAVAGLIFGAGPAVVFARRNLIGALREGGSTGGTTRTRANDALIVGQLAVSLGLIAAAALLGRSVLEANSADPGFEPRNMLVALVDPGLTGRYDAESAALLHDRIRAAAATLPGIQAVTLASRAPFVGPFSRSTRTPIEQQNDPEAGIEADAFFVDEHYFRTLDIPIVNGRAFNAPALEPEPVIIVNETLAAIFWPGEDAVGKVLVGPGEPRRVIGVAGDTRIRSLRGPSRPAWYEPLSESFGTQVMVHLRTTGDPLVHARAIREAVAEIDPGLPVTAVADLHTAMAGSLGETKSVGILVATFAALALLLSSVGLYGLVAWAVARRFREIGIRIALGADPRGLVRMVMARGLGITVLGLLIGTGLALLLGQALEGMLYGVGSASPIALAIAALLMFAAAALAAWIPARRATRVDAVSCLRY